MRCMCDAAGQPPCIPRVRPAALYYMSYTTCSAVQPTYSHVKALPAAAHSAASNSHTNDSPSAFVKISALLLHISFSTHTSR